MRDRKIEHFYFEIFHFYEEEIFDTFASNIWWKKNIKSFLQDSLTVFLHLGVWKNEEHKGYLRKQRNNV